jgi:DNA-binding NtrC family response regulator
MKNHMQDLGEHEMPFQRTESRYTINSIIAQSKAMRATLSQATELAHSAEPLLIRGERGTGKTLLARVIHAEGTRGESPFVTIRCNMLTLDCLDKVLFGDIQSGHSGKLADAGSGTLLLEGIENLCLAAQQTIYEVLSQGKFKDCHGDIHSLQCRIIATAFDQELDQLLNKGCFLTELQHFLSAATIEMPSLAERVDDIPYLVVELLDGFALREGLERPHVPFHYMELLTQVSWPGNVQQLRNHLESVMVLSHGEFQPAVLLEHFEQEASPATFKGVLQNLWGKLRGQEASLAAAKAK